MLAINTIIIIIIKIIIEIKIKECLSIMNIFYADLWSVRLDRLCDIGEGTSLEGHRWDVG